MKKPISIFIFLVICLGCSRQKNNSFIGVTIHCDTLVIHDTLTEIEGSGKIINIGTYHLVSIFTPVFDSAAYYRRKYKHFMALRTSAKTLNDVSRYKDSLIKCAELLSKLSNKK